MNNLNYDPITRFFEDTRNSHDVSIEPYDFSTLYLLIRDIETCFGFNSSTKERFRCSNCNAELEIQAQWPAVMGILAGIDLLGKFYAGNDEVGGVGIRFKNFVKEFFELNDETRDSSILYELRNSMLHSFGLYSNRYHFTLIANIGSPFIRVLDNQNMIQVIINVFELYKKFINALNKYYEELKKSDELKINFNNMFTKYGIIRQGPIENIVRL
jgi:hypothetical protein